MSGMGSKIIREMCRRLSPLTARLGFVLSPLHFYFPIPDVRDLARRDVWSGRSALAGIDWNEEGQLALIGELAVYGGEANWPEAPTGRPMEYHGSAPTFGYTSAMLAHGMVRHFKPRRIVEVGCGWSSLVLLNALAGNDEEGHRWESFIGIDPFPPDWLKISDPRSRLERCMVQDVDRALFSELKAGDILFIDSSHVLHAGSDVQLLYLDILPILAPGVVVHIHDIQLPWEYPREYAEKQRWFWNEQYLLQAFLAHNKSFEILAAGNWLCREKPEPLKTAFPHFDPNRHSLTGSFWMRRV